MSEKRSTAFGSLFLSGWYFRDSFLQSDAECESLSPYGQWGGAAGGDDPQGMSGRVVTEELKIPMNTAPRGLHSTFPALSSGRGSEDEVYDVYQQFRNWQDD